MNVKIDDVMTTNVLIARPDQTLGEVRETMLNKGIHAMPVVDETERPAGIITSSDLIGDLVSDDMLVSQFSTPQVYTIPRYDGVHVAARIMRNHNLHHVIVTDEKKNCRNSQFIRSATAGGRASLRHEASAHAVEAK